MIQGGPQLGEREICLFIQAFGFEWRRARGEAEAELAYLNACGKIDGVMTVGLPSSLKVVSPGELSTVRAGRRRRVSFRSKTSHS